MTRANFAVITGFPWLNMANTVILRKETEVDLLSSPAEWMRWLNEAAVLGGTDASEKEAFERSNGGEGFLAQARELRSLLRRIASRLVTQKEAYLDVPSLNDWLALGRGQDRVVMEARKLRIDTQFHHDRPLEVLGYLAWDAATFLVKGDSSRLRQCENSQCVLFFYDNSKNRSRRWCQMKACGNRLKVAAYYRRTRSLAHREDVATKTLG